MPRRPAADNRTVSPFPWNIPLAPNTAADDPRKTKKSVYIQPSVLIFQSPGADWVMPIARLRGSQNTLKP